MTGGGGGGGDGEGGGGGGGDALPPSPLASACASCDRHGQLGDGEPVYRALGVCGPVYRALGCESVYRALGFEPVYRTLGAVRVRIGAVSQVRACEH